MLDENVQKLMKAIEELKERARDGWVIVVEGIRDMKSLRLLGVEGEILVFSSYREIADRIRNRKVIILTDCDKKGMEIEKGLIHALSSWGNIPDIELKRKIFSLIQRRVVTVENLYKYILKHALIGDLIE